MEEERLIQHLKNIIQERGGKRKKRDNSDLNILKEFKPKEFANEFEDDGSRRFKIQRAKIAKSLATEYGIELKYLPEKDIEDAMRELKHERDLEIKNKLRELKDAQKLVDKQRGFKSKAKRLEELLEAQEALQKGNLKAYEEVEKYGNPKYGEYQKEKTLKEEVPAKLSKDQLKDLIAYKEKDQLLLGKGRRKKKPSAYNNFVAKHRKAGYSMSEIGKMWKSK